MKKYNQWLDHDESKLTWELYWLLIRLQEVYEITDTEESLHEFCKRRTEDLFPKAFDWILQDNKEKYDSNDL